MTTRSPPHRGSEIELQEVNQYFQLQLPLLSPSR